MNLMNNELSKVIVEMSINDISASDIEISGFLSECAVATSLINNYMKQMFLLEYTDVPLTEFGYVQEASVSDVKDKIKTAARSAATAILNFLKKIGTLILNFFNWLFGKNKLDDLIKKVDSMSSISMQSYEAYEIVNCIGGFLATLSIYENFAYNVTSMNTTSSSYEKLDRELDSLISVGTSKSTSEYMVHVFDDIIHTSSDKKYRSTFGDILDAAEENDILVALTGERDEHFAKYIIRNTLKNVKEAKPIEKASKILKSLDVNIGNFDSKLIDGEPRLVEIINGIAKKLNRSYGIYQKKCVSFVAELVKATEKENEKGTTRSAKKPTYTFDVKKDDKDKDEEESVL